MVHFLLKLLLKQRILAVHHDFRWLMVATKLLTVKLHVMWKIRSRNFGKVREFGRFTPDSATLLTTLHQREAQPRGSGVQKYVHVAAWKNEKCVSENGNYLWAINVEESSEWTAVQALLQASKSKIYKTSMYVTIIPRLFSHIKNIRRVKQKLRTSRWKFIQQRETTHGRPEIEHSTWTINISRSDCR